MKFTDLFIRRPVVATVVNLLILLAGYQAMRSYKRPPISEDGHLRNNGLHNLLRCGR